MSGPTSALGAAIDVIAARPEAMLPRSSPHLVGKLIAERARATKIQVDARPRTGVMATQEVRAASTEVALDRATGDPS